MWKAGIMFLMFAGEESPLAALDESATT